MIRINLLQEKKAKKAPPGQQQVLLMLVGLMGLGVVVYMFVHKPLDEELETKRKANAAADRANRELEGQMKDFETVKQQAQIAAQQGEAIKKLNQARVVPAWFLHELSRILTKGSKPTQTTALAKLENDDKRNRQYDDQWDPKRLWIETITEQDGSFTLTGGAQNDTDVTQLALRLQASAYFKDVVPEGGDTVEDQKTKVKYYKFSITGKVVY